MTAGDKTLQIGFHRAGSWARCTGPRVGPVSGPRGVQLPALSSFGAVEARGYRLASYLGEGGAEGRAACEGSAVTQPPGQAARPGFPSQSSPAAGPSPPPTEE